MMHAAPKNKLHVIVSLSRSGQVENKLINCFDARSQQTNFLGLVSI